ncbi:hypothetical protein L9F63_023332, partial [Diploptera punctata]
TAKNWRCLASYFIIDVLLLVGCAVIGGGIGGTSASYFLYELFGPKGAQIDLYEPNQIGGRLSVIEVNGRNYEAGGSIIHGRNKYMVDFLKHFGLKKRENGNSRFGLYDGKDFILTESKWELITLIKLAWRYGFGPLKLQNYIDDLLNKFERIYFLQDNGKTFLSVTDLLNAMSPDFVQELHVTAKDGFIGNGFSERIIDELITATLTANYGQSTIHSKAALIDAKVTDIIMRPENDDFLIHYTDIENRGNKTAYDIVIVATPLAEETHTGIKFNNFPQEFKFPGRYHRTSEEDAIDEILTVKTGLDFNSVGKIQPVYYKKGEKDFDVWKFFHKNHLHRDN